MSKSKKKKLEENREEASGKGESGTAEEECSHWIEFHLREDQTDKKLEKMKLQLEGPGSKKQTAKTNAEGVARLEPAKEGAWKILSVEADDIWETVGDPTVEG